MSKIVGIKSINIQAIKISQWLAEWEHVNWDLKERRAEPQHWFYLFSISAPDLKALSGIYARSTKGRTRGADDLGIQRRHEEERSQEIARFIKYGYPWSELSKAKRESNDYMDLQNPGWLPTAIVINILQSKDLRLGKKVDKNDLIKIEDINNNNSIIHLPNSFSGKGWKYNAIPPIEIIDGQHRLWAFEETEFKGNFELPVVAFVGLDISWQAYLFYTINIKPKKINSSLAFDLYPLLRTEDWLNKFEGHAIYRESRAQELVDVLWSHPQSPWHERINMLGEPGFKGTMVSQSAWIHSLLVTYIKSWEGRGVRVGGLFGCPVGSNELTLPWNRAEQAAFLIVIGQSFRENINISHQKWAESLRKYVNWSHPSNEPDPAFFGAHTLLNQDQGIRAFLYITNDLFFVQADKFKLFEWGGQGNLQEDDQYQVTKAIDSLKQENSIMEFIKEINKGLSTYDWRASSAPGLSTDESLLKAAFRGSGGYKELRRHLIRHLSECRGLVGEAAKEVQKVLGY